MAITRVRFAQVVSIPSGTGSRSTDDALASEGEAGVSLEYVNNGGITGVRVRSGNRAVVVPWTLVAEVHETTEPLESTKFRPPPA